MLKTRLTRKLDFNGSNRKQKQLFLWIRRNEPKETILIALILVLHLELELALMVSYGIHPGRYRPIQLTPSLVAFGRKKIYTSYGFFPSFALI